MSKGVIKFCVYCMSNAEIIHIIAISFIISITTLPQVVGRFRETKGKLSSLSFSLARFMEYPFEG